jgi:hypothetical protein
MEVSLKPEAWSLKPQNWGLKPSFWLVVALAAVMVSACRPVFVPQRPHPAPTAQELLGLLEDRHRRLNGLDLETRTTSWLRGQRVRATVFMLADRQGRLRFEAEVALQGAVATLVTDGDRFALLDLEGRIFRHGPACPENVASLIPLPLRPAEIAAVLLGDAPLGPETKAIQVLWDGHARTDVLELARPAAGQVSARLWVGFRPAPGGRWDVVALEGESPGRAGRWRVAYEDLKRADGLAHPGVIRFAEAGRSFDEGVEIKVRQRVVNPAVKDQAFTLTPPEGYPVELVPCPPVRGGSQG